MLVGTLALDGQGLCQHLVAGFDEKARTGVRASRAGWTAGSQIRGHLTGNSQNANSQLPKDARSIDSVFLGSWELPFWELIQLLQLQ